MELTLDTNNCYGIQVAAPKSLIIQIKDMGYNLNDIQCIKIKKRFIHYYISCI